MSVKDKHGHYHKNVEHLTHVDVYRILELFNVTSPPLQHAIKKLLLPGGRHAKDLRHDLQEARDSITRALEMLDEDAHLDAVRMGMALTTKDQLEATANHLMKQTIIVDGDVFKFGAPQSIGRAKRPTAKKSKKLVRAAAPKPHAGRKGHKG